MKCSVVYFRQISTVQKDIIYRLIYLFSGLKWINLHLSAKASKSYNFNKTYVAGHLGGYLSPKKYT